MITTLSREELYFRHQLSHDQIDDILVEKRVGEFPELKAKHLGKLHAFLRVCDLFDKSGISYIPQKGPILAFRLSGDPLYRTYVDLDFYVYQDQIQNAVSLLLNNGFKTPFYTLPKKKCHSKLLFKHVNEIILVNSELSINIELHWSLFNCKLIDDADFDLILQENISTILYQGRNYTVFKDELELIFLIIHGTLHGWSKLKWIVDVWIFLQKFELDESNFNDLVKQFKAKRSVSVCNVLLKIYFPGSKQLPLIGKGPDTMVKFALRQIRQPIPAKGMIEFFRFFMNNWRAFPDFGYRVDLLKRNLFATDLANASWMPCSALAFYLISPFWKLARGFRG